MQFTPESIFKTLQAVQEARGKKVSWPSHIVLFSHTKLAHLEH